MQGSLDNTPQKELGRGRLGAAVAADGPPAPSPPAARAAAATGPLARGFTAVIAVAAACGLTLLLPHSMRWAGPMLLVLAVTLAAWFGGYGAALLAAALAAVCTPLLSPRPAPATSESMVIFGHALAAACYAVAGLLVAALRAAREHVERALRERDARLQLVSEQIPAALWSTDANLHVTTGFGAGMHTGDPGGGLLAQLQGTHADPAAVAAHHAALRGESATYEAEWRGHTFQCHVEPLRNLGGATIGVVGVALDISGRKQTERSLLFAKEQAETAAGARDRFLAMLSHELRTPLTPALSVAASLAANQSLDPQTRDDLEMIRRNIELEARLIDDLLDLTRVTRGKLQLQLRTIDVHELVHRAAEICRAEIDAKPVHFLMDLKAERRFVQGDPARLQQVLWNLLKNAVKFTPPGGSVRVNSVNDIEHRIWIEVADTGIGIVPEMLPRIFDAFEQGGVAVTRQYGGLGLGLAISKAVVDAHDGRILAFSDGADRGATFRLELNTVAAPLVPEPAPKSALGPALPPAGLRVLVVEDHADTLRMLTRLLRSAGHSVITASSVAAAVKAVESDPQPVDLVISDLGLPDGSGLELIPRIRQLLAARSGHAGGNGTRLRAIALSGYGMDTDIRKSLDAGFDRHITKPIDFRALEEAIASLTASPINA